MVLFDDKTKRIINEAVDRSAKATAVAIGSLDKKLGERVGHLDSKIEHLDKKLDEKVERLDKKLDEKVEYLDGKIDNAVAQLSKNLTDAMDRSDRRFDKLEASIIRFNQNIDQSIERAVGFYAEKTRDDISLVIEATDFIQAQLQNMVTREEFNDLVDEVRLNRLAIIDTNKDLGSLRARVDKLEHA